MAGAAFRAGYAVLYEPTHLATTPYWAIKWSGIGNREIADALVLSEGTVKNHVSSIFSKLAVGDRTKAVLRAIAMGLV